MAANYLSLAFCVLNLSLSWCLTFLAADWPGLSATSTPHSTLFPDLVWSLKSELWLFWPQTGQDCQAFTPIHSLANCYLRTDCVWFFWPQTGGLPSQVFHPLYYSRTSRSCVLWPQTGQVVSSTPNLTHQTASCEVMDRTGSCSAVRGTAGRLGTL